MMEVVSERCAGIDVGKKYLVVCLLTGAADQKPKEEIRNFGTTVGALEQLRAWLQENGCQKVVMESTGDYWQPVYNILEEAMEVVLANAQQVKNLPGKKSDRKDGRHLARLLRHGMIKGSFIPPREIRDLRQVTRRRRRLVEAGAAERNRIQKVLEGANVKLGNVLSDVFGKSGQDMLEALLENKKSAEEIADMARRRARSKIPAIRAALEGHRMREAHRFVIQQGLDHMAFLEDQISKLDDQIQELLKPFAKQHRLLQTVPALKQASAAEVIAEIGVNMQVFGSAANLASWAGKCPGSNESAGKHKNTRTCRGNRWLGAVLGECSWAASRKKGSVFRDKFQRISPRRGKKKAAVAVAHALLVSAYHVLDKGVPYQELTLDQRDENRRTAQARYHLMCLDRLGVKVQRNEGNVTTEEGLIVLGRVSAESFETGEPSVKKSNVDRRSRSSRKKSCTANTKRTPRTKPAQ
jgi:transposase